VLQVTVEVHRLVGNTAHWGVRDQTTNDIASGIIGGRFGWLNRGDRLVDNEHPGSGEPERHGRRSALCRCAASGVRCDQSTSAGGLALRRPEDPERATAKANPGRRDERSPTPCIAANVDEVIGLEAEGGGRHVGSPP
jgi:hypothetical protein